MRLPFPASILISLSVLFLPATALVAQVQTIDKVYFPEIRSVQFYRGQNELNQPYMYLGDETPITLEFDELVSNPGQDSRFYAAVKNCDADWNFSDMNSIEYLSAFDNYLITDWIASVTNRIPYVHYRFPFSISTFGFKRSGNYLLFVYQDGNSDNPVLSKRFIVAERQVGISPKLLQSYAVSQRTRLQTLSFDVFPNPALNAFNPASDYEVFILQNNRWDNAKIRVKPLIAHQDRLEFAFDSGLEFEGGNEFRLLDIRSSRFRTQLVQTIEDRDSVWYYKLFHDKERRNYTYTTLFDFNGSFYIEVQEYQNADWQSDYAWVRFAIEQPEAFKDRQVYLSGAFTQWSTDPEFRLAYNSDKHVYETEVLLKQGIYNFKYVTLKNDESIVDETWFEGSHSETENAYTILVYYKSPMDRSHRLVGMSQVNYQDR